MELEKTISECIRNASRKLQLSTDEMNRTAPRRSLIWNDGLDSETKKVTIVCFSLALFAAFLHVLLNLCFRRIRHLYGPSVFIGLMWFFAAHLTILTSCSLPQASPLHRTLSGTTDFCILAAVATNFMSSVAVCRQFWLGAMQTPIQLVKPVRDTFYYTVGSYTFCWPGRLIYWLFWVLITLGIPSVIIILQTILFDQKPISALHADFANYSCNLGPNQGRFYLFFPSLLLLLLAQLICIVIGSKLRYGSTGEQSLLAHLTHLTARYWIVMKMGVTYTAVWLSAFVSLLYASEAIWHVFSLLSSLQAIYITVNCTFTRPVLDLIHQWYEDRIEEGKPEHNIVHCGPREVDKLFAVNAPSQRPLHVRRGQPENFNV